MLCTATHRKHQPQRDGCDARFRTGVKDPQIAHERVEMVDGDRHRQRRNFYPSKR
jgi:hypothetical protein